MTNAVLRTENNHYLKSESGGFFSVETASTPAPENFNATSASNTASLFQSSGQSRDVEVSLTARPNNGTVFLRYDGTKGIYFYFSGASTMHIGLASGITGQNYDAPASTYAKIYQDVGVSTGTIVCGVSGVEVYVKVNGTKVISFFDWHIPTSGYVLLKAANTINMQGTVTFLAQADIYSVPSSNQWDIRDFGGSTATTTGTISASSTSLVVASSTGFNIGDHVIVEIGAEAGAGARGTVGVGGVWPSLAYANSTTRAADTGQANSTYAYQTDTGNVYRWATGSPGAWTQVSASNYYSAKAVPRSLFARITGKSGNTLTLNTAATVAATNANVYFDNATKITNIMASIYYNAGANGHGNMTAFETTQRTAYVPAGTWYFASRVESLFTDCQIKGAGDTSIWKHPKGCPGGIYLGTGVTGEVANNIKMIGNVLADGFGLAWAMTSKFDGVDSTGNLYLTNDDAMGTSNTSDIAWPRGTLVYAATGATVRNITTQDIFYQSVGVSNGTNCWIRNCSNSYTNPLKQYIQWSYQIADSTGGGISGCTSTGTNLHAAAELFRTNGSAVMENITTTNGVFSLNSSGDVSITNPTITIQTNSQDASAVIASTVPIINVNNNIGGGYAGNPVSITGVNITQQGVINATNDLLSGIVINTANSNVSINGTTISFPDYVTPSGGSPHTDQAAIISDGANTDVANLTITGKSPFAATGSGNKNVSLRGSSTIASGSSIDAFTKAHVGDWSLS